MPGRPAIPIATHRARGTYRKGRHAGKAAVPDDSLGQPPAWFAVAIAGEWAEVIRQRKLPDGTPAEDLPVPEWLANAMAGEWARLAKLPHIKAAHRVAVEHACVLYARFVMDAMGLRGMTASERQTLHSLYMQLGCTPASAAKVPAAPVPKTDDPWAKL